MGFSLTANPRAVNMQPFSHVSVSIRPTPLIKIASSGGVDKRAPARIL